MKLLRRKRTDGGPGGVRVDPAAGEPPGAEPGMSEAAAARQAGNEGPGSDPRGRLAASPTEIPKLGWKDVGVRAVREFQADDISMVAAAAAFYAWLALLPAVLSAIMLYGLFANPETVSRQFEALTANLSDDVRSTLEQPVQQATNGAGGGLTLGVVLAIAGAVWGASGGMNGLIQGIGIAYDETDDRGFVKKRGLAILLTLGGILMFVVLVSLIAVVPAALDALGLGTLANLGINVGRWVLLALLMAAGLAVLYRVAPDRDDARLEWVTPGALVAMVLWLAVSAGFSFYVSNFGSYNKTYGALAGVIILELWLYLTMMIILFGAELNAELESQTAKDTTTGPAAALGHRDAQKADEVGPSTG